MTSLTDRSYTVPVGTLTNLPRLLDTLGVDGWTFLEHFGLAPSDFRRPMQPIPLLLAGRILVGAIDATGCKELPLLLGARAKMDNIGSMSLLVTSAVLVRDAIEALIRFRQVWYPGFQLVLLEEHGMACLAVALGPTLAGNQPLKTTFISAVTRHLHAIIGPACRIRAVHLSLATPADTSAYRRVFGQLPSFGQESDAVFFDASLLDLRRASSDDGEVQAFLRRQLANGGRAREANFAEQVSELIGTLLMGRQCNVERLAEMLGMHRLTLYRRLQQHHTTFEILLDQQRRSMAEEMLARRTMDVSEVADALGYSSPTNFARAFRRWHDCSPSAWLKQR